MFLVMFQDFEIYTPYKQLVECPKVMHNYNNTKIITIKHTTHCNIPSLHAFITRFRAPDHNMMQKPEDPNTYITDTPNT